MDGVISIPVWLVAAAGFIAALTWIIMTHGRAPFAENEKPFENLMEVVGKPYVLIVFLASAALLIGAYVFYLNDIVISVHQMVKHLRSETAKNAIESDTLRNLAQGSALLLGALVAVSTLIFTLIRTWINERTTTATEEGLVTDRINAAVASLGAEKTKKDFETGKEYTVPNIEVRVGAILSLERIAQKNADFHIQIMEILTAYLRENARIIPKSTEKDMRPDTQMAFSVIGRRSAKRIALERDRKPHPYRLDLRFCDFRRVEGVGLNFEHALFTKCYFDRADLSGVYMNFADLSKAHFTAARLTDAYFNSAKLTKARLNYVNMTGAHLSNACLRAARLKNAWLMHAKLNGTQLSGANFNKADLRCARFNDANLTNARLDNAILINKSAKLSDKILYPASGFTVTEAILIGASIRGLDCVKIPFTLSNILTMFGDGSVTLPNRTARPAHWPNEVLDWPEYKAAWLLWQKSHGMGTDS